VYVSCYILGLVGSLEAITSVYQNFQIHYNRMETISTEM